ncbi:hypothetical protein [Streptomyces candidus]|uniref:Uncharacterized protein n=1 Tax=Streptomyces candidus TaxID=67283 RepID=A0A7X0LT12_9ACTN|nr:hypothetical protein [Streptomyces candidus]MBB6439830.1 hypothetical protein [Streptomyces candidus]GHH57084.1 hypothetical protein GCM10018773_63930 [Streptomyces candidus]
MDFESVADELYGLRPEDFTAARNERARAARTAGDRNLAKRITALRRPTLSAWASNLLVREQSGEVGPLVRLGEQLRQAHHNLDGEQLRELTHQQRVLIGALSRQARQLTAEAGHEVSEDVQQEVEETLHAVLADPQAATEWAAGRLVKPLSTTSGFAAAQGASAGAAQPSRTPKAAPARGDASDAEARRRKKLDRTRQEAEDAQEDLRQREKESAAISRQAQDAGELVQNLKQRVTELAEELKSTEEQQRKARTEEREARGRARDADRRMREARRRAEAAAAQVKRLTDDGR